MGVTFKDFLKQNKNKNESKVNEDIILGIRSESLADYIVAAFRTLESRYLKVVDWEVITDENEIDTDSVNITHIKNKKNKKFTKRMSIDESRYDMLKIKFKFTAKNKDGHFEDMYYILDLLLFKKSNKYYYRINGNNYYPIYQLVEASTYNTKDFLILKTLLLPIKLKKSSAKLIDINGKNFYVPYYPLCIFKNQLNPLHFYMSTIGLDNTLIYMNMDGIIRIDNDNEYDDETEYCFPSEGGLFIKVIKYFFDNDSFTRNMTYCFVDITSKCSSLDVLNDVNYWTCNLGFTMVSTIKEPQKAYIKGMGIIISYARLLDNCTKKELKLKYYNKQDMFSILRWMLRNFEELFAKDNMDLKNKRIRMGEYIAAYLIKKLSKRMNKFMAIQTPTFKDLETLVNMEPDYLIRTVTSSKKPLLRYDNSTAGDFDLFTSLKVTFKGPNAIGGSSPNSVNDRYRGIHPSYIGVLDINTSGNSDPGLTTMLTPFAKLHGKNFSDEQEPQGWDDRFAKLYEEYFNNKKDVKKLNYFFEDKSDKKLIRLQDAKSFVDNNDYVLYGTLNVDDTNEEYKKLQPEIIKKKPGRKKKDDSVDKIRTLRIHRLNKDINK